MTKTKRTCFVIMPFQPDFHYFYLYLQHHVELKHSVECKRGDSDVLTAPLLEKIRNYINEADVLIADCSGRNPNVFYELGMAHALGKKVILITKEPISEAPADIRHFEFIRYEPTKDSEFFTSLDKALRTVFIDRYDELYALATDLVSSLKESTQSKPNLLDKASFTEAMISAEQSGELPSSDDDEALRDFLLPKAIANRDQKEIIQALAQWYKTSLQTAVTNSS